MLTDQPNSGFQYSSVLHINCAIECPSNYMYYETKAGIGNEEINFGKKSNGDSLEMVCAMTN